MADRLSAEDWIAHGFAVLKTQGHEALKADKMVKALGVSRGSFYWHFENLAAFEAAVLRAWRKQVTEAVIAELQKLETENAQLRQLILQVMSRDQSLEAGIRRWAGADPKVAKLVNEVDDLRTRYVEHLFLQSGISPQGAKARSQFLNWAYVGFAINAGLGQKADADWADRFAQMLMKLE